MSWLPYSYLGCGRAPCESGGIRDLVILEFVTEVCWQSGFGAFILNLILYGIGLL